MVDQTKSPSSRSVKFGEPNGVYTGFKTAQHQWKTYTSKTSIPCVPSYGVITPPAPASSRRKIPSLRATRCTAVRVHDDAAFLSEIRGDGWLSTPDTIQRRRMGKAERLCYVANGVIAFAVVGGFGVWGVGLGAGYWRGRRFVEGVWEPMGWQEACDWL